MATSAAPTYPSPGPEPSPAPDPSLHKRPRDNSHNKWKRNDKIKTCKCWICSGRVKNYSWQCDQCNHHICSECADPDGSSSDAFKVHAANHLEKKCNCFYSSGIDPELVHRDPSPAPTKKEQERIARDFKANRAAMPSTKERDESFHTDSESEAAKESEEELSDEERSVADDEDSEYDETPAHKKQKQKLKMQPSRAATREVPSRTSRRMGLSGSPQVVTRGSVPFTRFTPTAAALGENSDPDEDIAEEYTNTWAQEELRQHHRGHRGRQGNDDTFMATPEQISKTPGLFLQTLNEQFNAGVYGADKAVVTPESSSSSSLPSPNDPHSINSTRMTPASPPPHLVDGHTVIIGAGIVGLLTARELATQAEECGMNHKITVVDIRRDICELASGKSAGILTSRGMPHACHTVSDFARQAWEELWKDHSEDLIDRVDFDHVLLIDKKAARNARPVATPHPLNVPSWWTGDYSHASKDTQAFACL